MERPFVYCMVLIRIMCVCTVWYFAYTIINSVQYLQCIGIVASIAVSKIYGTVTPRFGDNAR